MTAGAVTPSPWAARLFVGVAALAAVWILFELAWIATGTPDPVVDYAALVSNRTAAQQPEGRDGWPSLMDAALNFESLQEACRADVRSAAPNAYGPDLRRLLVTVPDPVRQPFEHRLLAEFEASGALERLDDAATCPRFVRPMELKRPMMFAEIPSLGRVRQLAVARVVEMRRAALRGDGAAQVRAYEHALACARAVGHQAFLIDRLVAYAIFQAASDELACELIETPPDLETVRALRSALDRQMHVPPFAGIIETERAMGLDFIQWAYTDDGHGDGRLDPKQIEGLYWGVPMPVGNAITNVVTGATQAGRRETRDLLDQYYDALAVDASKSPARRVADGSATVAVAQRLTPRHIILQTMLPALDKAVEADDLYRSQRVAFEIHLALAEFRAIHGGYPDSLDELVPGELDALPLEPAGGRPFVYRRLESCAQGVPYLLYGLGADGTDETAGLDLSDLARVPTLGRSVTMPGMDCLYSRWRTLEPEPLD